MTEHNARATRLRKTSWAAEHNYGAFFDSMSEDTARLARNGDRFSPYSVARGVRLTPWSRAAQRELL